MTDELQKFISKLESKKVGAPIEIELKIQKRIALLELNEVALGSLESEFSWEDLELDPPSNENINKVTTLAEKVDKLIEMDAVLFAHCDTTERLRRTPGGARPDLHHIG